MADKKEWSKPVLQYLTNPNDWEIFPDAKAMAEEAFGFYEITANDLAKIKIEPGKFYPIESSLRSQVNSGTIPADWIAQTMLDGIGISTLALEAVEGRLAAVAHELARFGFKLKKDETTDSYRAVAYNE
jgi:hypothetical protein